MDTITNLFIGTEKFWPKHLSTVYTDTAPWKNCYQLSHSLQHS
jgi:hypothetical protein